MPKVVAVNISERKGTPKSTVESGELLVNHGLRGDAHAGAGHRQVSLLAQESIDKMKAAGFGGLEWGSFAENITTLGIELYKLRVGTRLRIGDAELEISQIGKECHGKCAVYQAAGTCIMPREGVFAVVRKGGVVKEGDKIEVL